MTMANPTRTFRASRELWEELYKLADYRDMSMSDLIVELIEVEVYMNSATEFGNRFCGKKKRRHRPHLVLEGDSGYWCGGEE